uniref:C-type lectin domain-containing protein n=1 Tax=Podarcis muralis TaxID=64176 RepID=A0A670K9L4_PODMU
AISSMTGFLSYITIWSSHFVLSYTLTAADRCPRGWLQYQGNCYGFFHNKLSWHEAEIECQSYGRGTHLTSILARAETLMKQGYVWIGLHDTHQVSI